MRWACPESHHQQVAKPEFKSRSVWLQRRAPTGWPFLAKWGGSCFRRFVGADLFSVDGFKVLPPIFSRNWGIRCCSFFPPFFQDDFLFFKLHHEFDYIYSCTTVITTKFCSISIPNPQNLFLKIGKKLIINFYIETFKFKLLTWCRTSNNTNIKIF